MERQMVRTSALKKSDTSTWAVETETTSPEAALKSQKLFARLSGNKPAEPPKEPQPQKA